jgi:photosystem II stability/assembly factor-like uncharacterized protein
MVKSNTNNFALTALCGVALVLAIAWLSRTEYAFAHSPHDPIDALALSPAYATDKTVFIVIADHLRKSTDGGYSWKELVNGLDHKNLLSSIAISPSFISDRSIFVSSDGDGIYQSKDAGKSWKKVNRGLDSRNIGMVSISSVNYNGTAFAAGTETSLYKTKDDGKHWFKVLDQAQITSLAFWPEPDKKQIFAGDANGNLYFSNDNGSNWDKIYNDKSLGRINSIVVVLSYDEDHSIFIGTEKKGVLKASDGVTSFRPINRGLPERANIQSLVLVPGDGITPTIFASTWHEAVFRSTDGGENWKKYDKGLTKNSQANSDKYRSPHFRSVRAAKSPSKDKFVFLAGFDGLFKSTNAGHNWFELETLPVGLIKGLAVSPGSGNNTIAITTYGGGAYLSEDNGNSWFVCNRGLKTTRLSDIVFSPDYQTDKTIHSASIDFLLKSTDSGKNWQKIIIAHKSWRHRVQAILRKFKIPSSWRKKILKKSERKRKWPTVIVLSPNYSTNKQLFFATRYHGVFKSDERSRNPINTWDGLGRTITSMVMSSDFDTDRTIFASVRAKGIYKTQDKGKSWQTANEGLPFTDEWQRADTVHQIFKTDIKLAISPSYTEDKTVFAGSSEGLFKSSDAGFHWYHLHDGLLGKNDYVIGLAVSPGYGTDQNLLVSLRGKGLLKSTDGGRTFKRIGDHLLQTNHAIEFIHFSPNYIHDHTIYAASDEDLFRSENGGVSWQIIKRPVRYENNKEALRYEGDWSIVEGAEYSASYTSTSDTTSDQVNFNFVGSGIALIGPRAPNLGIAEVYIDGKYTETVDQYSRQQSQLSVLYTIKELGVSPHTLTIKVAGTRNRLSTGNSVSIDAIDVLP